MAKLIQECVETSIMDVENFEFQKNAQIQDKTNFDNNISLKI